MWLRAAGSTASMWSTAVQVLLMAICFMAGPANAVSPNDFFSSKEFLGTPITASGPLISLYASSSSAAPHWVPAQHQQQSQQKIQQKPQQQAIAALPLDRPHVIAHRGASGLLPEHTLAAYERAIAQGADFIECDIVVTKDLQLVCRHEPNLNSTTSNVMDLFSDRIMTYNIDGQSVTGIFASDLTLSEIKQLRATQRWEFRDHSYDGVYQIATLDEYLDLADSASSSTGRAVGIYPEIKHPTWHNKLPQMVAAGATSEELVVQKLHDRGYAASAPFGSQAWRLKPVYVQCFEPSSLQKLSTMTEMPLVLLLGGWQGYVTADTGLSMEDLITDENLDDLSKFVAGIGPWKSSLFSVVDHVDHCDTHFENDRSTSTEPVTSNNNSLACRSGRCSGFIHPDAARINTGTGSSRSHLQSSGLVAKLQKHGLQVHPYTLRDEQQFVPSSCNGDIECEFAWLFDNEGVDGAFADYPGTLVNWLQKRQAGPANT